MSNEVINPYQTFRDDNGVVLANGTITVYANTTTTIDSIFSDEALTVAQNNPYTLDAYGRIAGDVRFSGKKTLKIATAAGAHVRTLDNVQTSMDSSETPRTFATLSLAVASTTIEDGDVLNIAERTTGNGGGGTWDVVLSSTVTENTYNIVQCTGVGTLSLVLRMDGVISIDQLGAGTADDLAVLIHAATLISSGLGVVEFSSKTYNVSTDTAKGMFFNAKADFVINGNNATIKVLNSEPLIADGVIMWFEDCENVVVNDLVLDGNRDNRTPAEGPGAHCAALRDACFDVTFNNVKFINGATDGLYIATSTPGTAANTPTDITLNNCVTDNCYRNGVSPINTLRFTVNGGRYINTIGTAPQCGIDLEDNGTAGNVDAVIDGALFSGNAGSGLTLTGVFGCTNPIVRNCKFYDNAEYSLIVALCHGVTLHDLVFNEHTASTRGILDLFAAATTDVSIKNIEFRNANVGAAQWCMYVHSSVLGPVIIDGVSILTTDSGGIFIDPNNVTLKNVTVKDSTGSQSSTLSGSDIVVRNWSQDTVAGGLLFTTTDPDIDGFHSKDCTGGYHLATLETGVVVRNATAIQKIAKPSGQDAFRFIKAPDIVVNCYADKDTYTSADAFEFTAGLNDETLLESLTPGYFTKSSISASVGDADKTLTRGISTQTHIWSVPLTTGRTATLSATNARAGDRFKIVRNASSTGGSNLSVGGLKNLATSEWAEVEYTGSAWVLTGFGAL